MRLTLRVSANAERELARLAQHEEEREARAWAFYLDQLREARWNRAAWMLKQRVRVAIAKLARIQFDRTTPEVTGKTLRNVVLAVLGAAALLWAAGFVRGIL